MTDKELNELIGYIKPVDVTLLAPPVSANYARYSREKSVGVSADCVAEGSGAFDSKREEVRHLRLSGLDLKEITRRTGIPQEQVEIYCHELGLPIEGSCRLCVEIDETELIRKCVNCGSPLTGRSRKFCCSRCKNAYIYQQRKKKRSAVND